VFAHAKDRFLAFARKGYKDYKGLTPPDVGEQLEKSPQKIESLYQAVNPARAQYKKVTLGPKFGALMPGYRMIVSEQSDSMCAALLPHTNLSLHQLQEKVPDTGDVKARWLALAKLLKRKIVVVRTSGILSTGDEYFEGEKLHVVMSDDRRYHALVK
jgi:hypothetical protein